MTLCPVRITFSHWSDYDKPAWPPHFWAATLLISIPYPQITVTPLNDPIMTWLTGCYNPVHYYHPPDLSYHLTSHTNWGFFCRNYIFEPPSLMYSSMTVTSLVPRPFFTKRYRSMGDINRLQVYCALESEWPSGCEDVFNFWRPFLNLYKRDRAATGLVDLWPHSDLTKGTTLPA